MAQPPAPGSTDQPLKVFIVGAPRSGTSILLRAAKDVIRLPSIGGESHAMPVFHRAIQVVRAELGKFEKKEQKLLVKEISLPRFEDHIKNYIREFYSAAYPAGRWVDKTPSGIAVAGLPIIESTFPDAKLVMIKRNGIEVVSSHLKKFKGSSFKGACTNWFRTMEYLLQARKHCQNLLEIDQYDLQNATEQVSQQLATHLQLPHMTEPLAKFFLSQRVQSSSTHDPKKRLKLQDMEWSPEEMKLFKEDCGPMMEKFGYDI